eukprot:Amastigsp_a340889_33.p2 type:complete len:231 gc:universal Amastigsp_a340889_33:722-30(-)
MPDEKMMPGATALRRTPRDAHSIARVLTRFSTPARAAPECDIMGMPPKLSAVMQTTRSVREVMPVSRARQNASNTADVTQKVPFRFVSMTACQPFGEIDSAGLGNCPPALFTKHVIGPCRRTASPTAATTASLSRMFKTMGNAHSRMAFTSATADASLDAERPAQTTALAPSAAASFAIARPIPEPPPVIKNTSSRKRPSRKTLASDSPVANAAIPQTTPTPARNQQRPR